MRAKVIEFWLIVECPHCHRPQMVNKYVNQNVVLNMKERRHRTCEYCDKGYYVEIQGLELPIKEKPV